METVEPFEFVGSRGHSLAGRLHRPNGQVKGMVLMAHCFTCSKDIHTTTRLASALADGGYTALRFDFTGLGQSGGDFAKKTVSGNVADLTRAAASLIETGLGPCGIIGHSLGGAAAVLAASRLHTVRSLVTISAPSTVEHVTHLFADDLEQLSTEGRATVTIAGRKFDLESSFLEDLHNHDVLEAAAKLDRPYCVVHAKDDNVVGFEDGLSLFEAAKEPKKLVSLESGGHMFNPRDEAETMVNEVVAWFDQTL